MNKRIFVIFVNLVIISFFPKLTKAQCDGSKADFVESLVLSLDDDYDISMSKSFYISENEYGYFYKTFYSGNHYLIIAFAEEDDVDIDLYLYDNDGDLYEQDDDSGDLALISFDNYSERDMKVKARVYDAPNSYSNYHVCVIVFYK